MIAVFPGRFVAAQKIQQLLAADSVTGGFHQKSAPTARTDEGVNLSNQVFWQQDVCAYYIHISSVTCEWEVVQNKNRRIGATNGQPRVSPRGLPKLIFSVLQKQKEDGRDARLPTT